MAAEAYRSVCVPSWLHFRNARMERKRSFCSSWKRKVMLTAVRTDAEVFCAPTFLSIAASLRWTLTLSSLSNLVSVSNNFSSFSHPPSPAPAPQGVKAVDGGMLTRKAQCGGERRAVRQRKTRMRKREHGLRDRRQTTVVCEETENSGYCYCLYFSLLRMSEAQTVGMIPIALS